MHPHTPIGTHYTVFLFCISDTWPAVILIIFSEHTTQNINLALITRTDARAHTHTDKQTHRQTHKAAGDYNTNSIT